MDEQPKNTATYLAWLWGQSVPAVSNDLSKFKLNVKDDGWAACTREKIARLRSSAGGYGGEDKEELQKRKIETEIELNELEIAKRAGTLVEIAALEPLLAGIIIAARVELMNLADKICDRVALTHAVELDKNEIQELAEGVLEQLARYEPVLHGAGSENIEVI